MVLRSTQPLTEMSTRCNFLGVKAAVVMKSGNLNFLETSGPLQACNGTALPFNSNCEIRKLKLVFKQTKIMDRVGI